MKTKASKTFTTYFFPVGDEFLAIVKDWADFLRTTLLFGPDDPLFPKTLVKPNSNRQFEIGLYDGSGNLIDSNVNFGGAVPASLSFAGRPRKPPELRLFKLGQPKKAPNSPSANRAT